ncbi:MAG TPA: EAL domain-containing protein [Sedimenticola sp.]|nr:EAL domain-containing protein [Sedimenticola sp.]
MKDSSRDREHYVSALIHKSFYHDERLDTPTVIKAYDKIEKILLKSSYLTCITIQIDQLSDIEYLYGSSTYNALLGETKEVIREMRERYFRSEDIFLVDLFENDTFIIFLAEPRNEETKILNHLDRIVTRAEQSIEKRIFNLLFPYTKEYAKPSVGYALVINNPMINNMRLIMQLISSSKRMGHFMAEKSAYRSRYLLQKVILEKDITSVFQPIVNLKTLDVLGYEALSRGPRDSVFSNPFLMFLLAAEYGLSFELDSICRAKAFESARALDSDKKIFVNTLAMTIHDPEFRGAYLEKLFEDMKIKPENVVFEINEKVAIANYELFRSSLKDYSDIGIVHASDDVGTGYSDLERIMELQPGFMKVDISLVRDLHNSHIKQEIIKAMVSLAKGLNSEIVAEGIESAEEFEALKTLGVTYGQGYLFGRPAEKLVSVDKGFLKK